MESQPHVVLGVTGSIAAYKAAELVRLMVGRGWGVSVVMTKAATRFVGEITFRTLSRNPVTVDMFDPVEEWKPEHIALAERGRVLVIAPCTANVIAKLAHGIADDTLSCVALACTRPIVIAPAMNAHMWQHPATRANVDLLRSRGVTVVDVGGGELACGYEGRGRLAELDVILRAVENRLQAQS